MSARQLRSRLRGAAMDSPASRALRRYVLARPRLAEPARRLMRQRPQLASVAQQMGTEERSPNEITNQVVLDLLKRRRFDEASTVVESFLQSNPRAWRSLYIAGIVEMYRDRPRHARRSIDRAYEHTWTIRDDLGQLPDWHRHISRMATEFPDWAWPRYMIAKSTSRVFGTSPEQLLRLVDGLEPSVVVEFTRGYGRGRHATATPVSQSMRVVVFESEQVGVVRHRRRLSDVELATVHHLPELQRSALRENGWQAGTAAALLEDAGATSIDYLHLDAEFASSDLLADLLNAGHEPPVIVMSLNRVTLRQRLDTGSRLRDRGYYTQFEHAQMVAVADHLVQNRVAHALRTPDADFDQTLVDDYVTDVPIDLAGSICDRLIQNQVRFLVTPVAEPHVTRISLGNPDKGFALSLLRDIEPCRGQIHITSLAAVSNRTPLIRMFLVDDERRYLRSTVEFDFWTDREDYVRTGNANALVGWIPGIHRERSMFALDPPFLLDEDDPPITMERRLGVSSSELDTYDFPVDVVFTWVDGNDPEWRRRRAMRMHDEALSDHPERSTGPLTAPDFSQARFRDREELRYALRSIQAFMPYVRHIFLVTDQQRPTWLVDHPQITVVDHSEIFERATDLPCFNSNAIESQLHRIPGLSEHFVYFNDDVMLLGPTPPSHFFLSNGVTRSFFESQRSQYGPPDPSYHNSKNAVLNASAAFEEHFGRTFHQYHRHTPFPLRTSVLERMHAEFGPEMRATASHHFRSLHDIAPISSLYQYFAFHVGAAVPSSIHANFVNLGATAASETLDELEIRPQGGVLCINDNDVDEDEEANVERALAGAFARLYPVAAPWERS